MISVAAMHRREQQPKPFFRFSREATHAAPKSISASMTSYFVRVATIDDSTQIAWLLSSLGHDTPKEQVVKNWHGYSASWNRVLVAATPVDELVGVVTLSRIVVLHRPSAVGRITALFVKDAFRNRGVGRSLVDAAEMELKECGCGLLEITSNFQLPNAHAFYEHLGYNKTSFRLAKVLGESSLIDAESN